MHKKGNCLAYRLVCTKKGNIEENKYEKEKSMLLRQFPQ